MVEKATIKNQMKKASSELSERRYLVNRLRRQGLLRPKQSLFSVSKYDKDYTMKYGVREEEKYVE